MQPTVFNKVDYTLSSLLQSIELGTIGLPDIQRPFVWPNTKVRDLFDSMYRGFPVGYLLFWVNGLDGTHRQIGSDSKQEAARLLIVDGQQRLTSLYAVIKGIPVVREDYRSERIYIAFRPFDGRFDVADAAIRKDPTYIADISQIWSSGTGLFKLAATYINSLGATRDVTAEEIERIQNALERLKAMETYPFTALELAPDVSEEQVADVFVRINSQGTRLNQADFILTLMSVFWDQGRAELERFCRSAKQPSEHVSPYNQFIKPSPDQLLRVEVALGFRRARLSNVYSILRGKDLESETFSEERRTEQFAILQQAQREMLDLTHWREFLKALLQAGYRSGDMIISENSVLYSYALYLIGKRNYAVQTRPLRDIIAQWFFMVTITSRYSGSAESTVEQDLSRLRDARDADGFVRTLRRIIDDTLTEDFWRITLPNSLAVSSARTPTIFAYHAALVLLDATVLFSKLKVSDLLNPAWKSKKAALERHHIFPKGYLAKIGISDQKDANQAANFALIEWMDNIEISAQSPASYLPKHLKRINERERAQQYYWHALRDGWEDMTYPDFLMERRKRIAAVTRAGFMRLQSAEVPEPVLETIHSMPLPEDDAQEPARHGLRLAFWRGLLDLARESTDLHANRNPVKNTYLDASSGIAYIYFYYSIRMDGWSVGLSVYHHDRTENKRVFDALAAEQDEIKGQFGAPLLWTRNSEGRGSWISYSFKGAGLLDQPEWPTIQEAMVDAMLRLEKALRPHLEKTRTKQDVTQ